MKLLNLIIFIYNSPFLIPHTGGKYFYRIKIHLKSFNIDLKIMIRLRKSLKIWKFHQTCTMCQYLREISIVRNGWVDRCNYIRTDRTVF